MLHLEKIGVHYSVSASYNFIVNLRLAVTDNLVKHISSNIGFVFHPEDLNDIKEGRQLVYHFIRENLDRPMDVDLVEEDIENHRADEYLSASYLP